VSVGKFAVAAGRNFEPNTALVVLAGFGKLGPVGGKLGLPLPLCAK